MRRLLLPCAILSGAALLLATQGCTDTSDLFGGAGGSGSPSSSSSMSTAQSGSSTSQTGATTGATVTTATVGSSTVASSTGSGQPICGDGVVNQVDEECDGMDLDGHDCTEQMYSSPGGVACSDGCKLDFGGCKATCGDMSVEPTEECDDGNAVDTDTCSSKCLSQGTCMSPIQIPLPLGGLDVLGSTSGMGTLQSSICQEATGPELVFQVMPMSAGYLTVWTDPAATSFDAIVYARSSCASANDFACGDNLSQQPDLVSFQVTGNQPVTIVLDGYQGQSGDFKLHFDLSTGVDCNDPVPLLVGDNAGFDIRVSGNTTGSNANETGTCGGIGNDVVYEVTRKSAGYLRVATTALASGGNPPTLNSVTHARSTCTSIASELACSSPVNDPNSTVTLNNAAAASAKTFVVIDGQSLTGQGPYAVVFDTSP